MKKSLEYYKDLVVVLTQKELKVRYKRSFLGYLWSIANPLALALVFFVAFKIFMKIPIENYTLFLIAGLFPWQWFLNSVNSSAMVFIGNATLIKKMHFRHDVLIVATVLNDMLHFILSIPVIILFLFIYGMQPSVMWFVGIPVLLIIQFIITMGFSLAIAAINLFFRDIERMVFIFTSLMFYMTPIIYSEEMVPSEYKTLILSNPLSILLISWRNLFMHGVLDFKDSALAFIYSVIVFTIGYLIYRRLKWRFAEVL
ncbi:MAG TPA: ABC transporter permease [Thermodesulfovibrionales bacterium]|jgi:lipopolysaccharide transport system permease protein|nr:ABC transporter permease [Thermodesulfovibrionales bacterium]